MRKRRLVLTLGCILAPVLGAQQDFSKVKITVVPVTTSIFMLQGAGGNIGVLVGQDDAFVIDDQFAPLSAQIKAAIATLTPKPVRYLVNTHWHGDHTGGNANMAAGGAVIVAHDNVRRRMSVQQFNAVFKSTTPASPAAALPVITFNDSLSFFVNGDTARVVHLKNAHTDGDAIIVFKAANVIHMGDTFFNGMYPFIDVSTGGSIDGTIAAAARGLAISNEQTKIIPGHGALGNRADLQKYHDVLVDVRTRVAKLVAQKMTLEQVVAAKPLADYDATFGKGFMTPEQFVMIVYTNLTAGGAGM